VIFTGSFFSLALEKEGTSVLKKKIQYKDFDGNNVVDEFYFNVNKAELAERELSLVGGWQKHMQTILDNVKTNPAALIDEMKWLLKKSYGIRSADGKKFYKSDEIYRDFEATDAHSELFFALCTDAKESADFVNGVLGETVAALSAQIEARGGVKDLELPKGDVPAPAAGVTAVRESSKAEVRKMSPAELKAAFTKKLAAKTDNRPTWLREGRAPTVVELTDMSEEDFEIYKDEIQNYL